MVNLYKTLKNTDNPHELQEQIAIKQISEAYKVCHALLGSKNRNIYLLTRYIGFKAMKFTKLIDEGSILYYTNTHIDRYTHFVLFTLYFKVNINQSNRFILL